MNAQRGYLGIGLGLRCYGDRGGGTFPQSNKLGKNKTKENTTQFTAITLSEMHNIHQNIKGYEKSYGKGAFCLCLSQHFPDRFDFPLITLVNILDEHMLGNIGLDDYPRDDWSPTWYDIKDKVIINALVSAFLDGNIGLMKAKPNNCD